MPLMYIYIYIYVYIYMCVCTYMPLILVTTFFALTLIFLHLILNPRGAEGGGGQKTPPGDHS